MFKNYNPLDKESIYEHAKKLQGKTFKDICNEDKYFLTEIVREVTAEEYKASYENKSRKGGLGEIVEERYFHYKADNISEADFPEVEVELKVTPYKSTRNGSVSAKERWIISMINYMKIIDMDFYNSNAWEKLKNLLIVYYLWDPEVEDRLKSVGFDVIVFIPSYEEDLGRITCGNAILSGSKPEVEYEELL